MRFRPLGLGGKLGAIFVGLGALIVLGVVVTAAGLSAVGTDARRLLEESREARLTVALAHHLERLAAECAGGSGPLGTADGALVDVRDVLQELLEGADDSDPSEAEHQSEETRLIERIGRDLDAIATWQGGGPEAPELGALFDRIEEGRMLAAGLGREMQREAFEAAEHLDRKIRQLGVVIGLSAAVSLLVLMLGFVLVHRNLVRPVRALREGSRRFGKGQLDHRVRIETRDEIGELAREFNDMAERLSRSHRDLEERVEERTQQFLHAARLAGVGTLAAGIAHEVNTPLATIASCAEGLERRLLAGSLDRETELDYLRTIAREAYRAREITSRVLAFARKDHGEVQLRQIEPSLREAVRILERTFEKHGVRLELEIAADLPAVAVEPPAIEQAVVNLLKNAAEATPSGRTVRLTARRHAAGLAIDVLDEGPGVPVEHRASVFDPFFTTKEVGKGTGLGLSLAYAVVERHGGSVSLHDGPGGGALFRIVLPAAARETGA